MDVRRPGKFEIILNRWNKVWKIGKLLETIKQERKKKSRYKPVQTYYKRFRCTYFSTQNSTWRLEKCTWIFTVSSYPLVFPQMELLSTFRIRAPSHLRSVIAYILILFACLISSFYGNSHIFHYYTNRVNRPKRWFPLIRHAQRELYVSSVLYSVTMLVDTFYYLFLGAVVLCMMLFNFRSHFLQNNFHSLLKYDLRIDVVVNNSEQTDGRSDFSSSIEHSTVKPNVEEKSAKKCEILCRTNHASESQDKSWDWRDEEIFLIFRKYSCSVYEEEIQIRYTVLCMYIFLYELNNNTVLLEKLMYSNTSFREWCFVAFLRISIQF
jgi:hypothetical protein